MIAFRDSWIAGCISPKAELTSLRRLPGSTSSRVYSASVLKDGKTEKYVLRQFTNQVWLSEEPDLVRHEAESLKAAVKCDIPSPKLIAYDEDGNSCGLPSILMTRMPGAVNLMPGSDIEQWLDGLAEALASIHSSPITDFPWHYKTYSELDSFVRPPDTGRRELWVKALSLLKKPAPESRLCFIHRDYHPANILWKEGKVSGVVDWVNACTGPAGIDVGHCRVNLALLFDKRTADSFLDKYISYAGNEFVYHPYWDLLSIIDGPGIMTEVYPGWASFGVNLSKRIIVQRNLEFLESVLKRF